MSGGDQRELSYFERLYRAGSLDPEEIQADRKAFNFETVATKYRLIDDAGAPVVVASWQDRRDEIEALIETVRQRPSRAAFRRLAPFQVNLRPWEMTQGSAGVGTEAPGLLVWRGGYDRDLGLTAANVDVLLAV